MTKTMDAVNQLYIHITPEMKEEMIEEHLYGLVAERLRNSTGVTYTFEEILAEDGMTLEDLDAMEDVELE